MRIDLHAHSTASDGTDSPAGLVRAAAAAGLDVVALTDHDTVSGWQPAATALPAGLTLVPGAEVSCTAQGIGLHLLAYLFDPADPALAAELTHTREDRVPRAQEMVRRMGQAGMPVTWELVLAHVEPGATVGRPHLADALVAAGVAPDRSAAFARHLHRDSPFYVRHRAADPAEAVRLVAAAGGVSVIAHAGASQRGRVVGDEVIAAMAEAGMAGLEVDHPDHDRATRERLRRLAGELGLVVTGSSDYHGRGKPNVLGQETTGPAAYEALVAHATGSAPLAA